MIDKENRTQNPLISLEEFKKCDMRVGTVIEAFPNARARKPAYILKIDFDGSLGIKVSSAQIAENYSPETLVGRQVVGLVNLPSKLVAGCRSEVLVLASMCDRRGTVLLVPDVHVTNGSRVA